MRNTRKQQLYNNVMRNVSRIIKQKLNEDLLSDLEDDNDDDSDFIISDRNIIKIFNGKPKSDFMDNYNKVGDLLTCQSDNLFYIIKNNKSIDEVRKNLNTRYGKIIGMCISPGLWMSTEFNYTKKYMWACDFEESYLYDAKIRLTYEDGWYNTQYIWNDYSTDTDDSIWDALYQQKVTGLGEYGICYLPAMEQLRRIFRNQKITKIKNNIFWTSTMPKRNAGYNNNVFSNSRYCALVCSNDSFDEESYQKDTSFMCLALLHFK